MKTTNSQTIRFRRLQAGYYYSTKPVTIDTIETHVVLEDTGGRWALRLESFPSMTSWHNTKRHARWALAEMMGEGSLALALQ